MSSKSVLGTCAFWIASSHALHAQDPSWFTDRTQELGLGAARPFRIVVSDVNNDSYPDLLFVSRSNELQLYLNLPRPGATDPRYRRFRDFTAESGIHRPTDNSSRNRHTSLAGFADVDNDGDVDLVLGVYYHRIEAYTDLGDRNEVLLNDGEGHFTVVPHNGLREAGLINTSSISFLDFNRDGFIDVFLGTWFRDYSRDVWDTPRLYAGWGDGTFEDVSASSGIGAVPLPLYGSNVADVDSDGNPDLLGCVYCRAPSRCWRNNGDGTFTDVASWNGFAGGSLCTWAAMPADFDNDQDIDLLYVMVHGTEGGTRSSPLVNGGLRSGYAFTWRPDLIPRSDPKPFHHGDHYAAWFDMDNDGLTDLVITENSYDALLDRLYVFRQNPDHTFADVTIPLGLIARKWPHATLAMDYDLDGDDDLLIGYIDTTPEELVVLQNEVGTSNRRITVRLSPPVGSNRDGIGARVTVRSGELTLTREVYAGQGNFGGQGPLFLNFGLGSRTQVDEVTVRWPDRVRTQGRTGPVTANQVVSLPGSPGPLPIDERSGDHKCSSGSSVAGTSWAAGIVLLLMVIGAVRAR